jgi:hypothetical protein
MTQGEIGKEIWWETPSPSGQVTVTSIKQYWHQTFQYDTLERTHRLIAPLIFLPKVHNLNLITTNIHKLNPKMLQKLINQVHQMNHGQEREEKPKEPSQGRSA